MLLSFKASTMVEIFDWKEEGQAPNPYYDPLVDD
jgi:hypothetical protein